ncbi:AMP-binding protein [Pseudonocardia sp. GCM10023141]|uniref:AMP-binding protein n=1 Tax=Pseudonocardia sp. GCM10023141 TaxID=3252653 RepID=UPI00360BFD0F
MTASLRELLEGRARSNPDDVVLVGPGEQVTWAQLHERAVRVAAGLVRDGVGVQERVLYLGKNDLRCFDVLFGAALAGAIPTPLNWRLAPRELAAIAADSGATVAFVDPELGELPVRSVAIGEIGSWWGPADDPGVAAEPDHIAFQLYTSGTTGRPKGAMFANGTNLRVLLDDISVAWGFTPADTSLVCMPLFHMGGVAWALAGMARGARGVVVRDFVPATVLDVMERERVTTAFCVPAMLAALCAVPGIDARALALRQMIYSGSPISTTALTAAMKALRCDFVQIYGLTEATGAFAQLPAADHDPGGPRAGLLRSAGRPYPWVEVRVDPPGGIGEILTRSEQNLVGYWNQPEETARALTPDGWLRTGDLGHLDDEGRIFLVDRAKDLIITGGENVYPAEVENVLAAHPAIAEVAVIGVPDERWGETVKAIVLAREGATVDATDVIAFARGELARFKCPTSVDVVATLPRTATGKVVKTELREPYWRGHDRRIN